MSALRGTKQDSREFGKEVIEKSKEIFTQVPSAKKMKRSGAMVTPEGSAFDYASALADTSSSTPQKLPEEDQIVDDNPESENEENDEEHELSEEEEKQLEEAFDYLMQLCKEGKLTATQVDDLIEWAEEEAEAGQDIGWIVGSLRRTKKREQVFTLPRFVGRKRIPQICQSYTRTSERVEARKVGAVEGGTSQKETLISEEPPEAAPGSVLWNQFKDEHSACDQLDQVQREVWIAQMEVKIKQVETLIKAIDSQDPTKKVTKFKDGEVFERYERNVKAELTSIPLVEICLEHGQLVNPRKMPDPVSKIFYKDINGVIEFDAISYGKSIMLWTLLEDLRNKTSGFLYSLITYCMQDNTAARDVIRADTSRDFYGLFRSLKNRFQINSEIEKEKLVQKFQMMVRGPKETPREFYGRMLVTVTELRTVFRREVLNEDLKRTFFKCLTDNAKSFYLQLASLDKYKNNFDDLCLEVIKYHEELESNIKVSVDTVNEVNSGHYKFRGRCNTCGKPGHKSVDCKMNDNNREKDNYRLSDSNSFLRNRKSDKKSEFMQSKWNKRRVQFDHKRHNKSNKDRNLRGNHQNKRYNAGNMTTNSENDNADDVTCITQCFLCHQRGDHESNTCPNADAQVKMRNNKYKNFQAQNASFDAKNPGIKVRVLVVTIIPASQDNHSSNIHKEHASKDFFTVRNSHGPEYAMIAMECRVIVIDSGASRSMFGNRAMFSDYQVLFDVYVFTASGEAIPVLGCGTVGEIPNCLHVPNLEKDLISAPQLDLELGWSTTFISGTGVIRDKHGNEILRGTLDRSMMLYTVNREQLLGKNVDRNAILRMEAQERALSVMTKCDYVNKLHDIFHCHSRRLEALVKTGVIAWPYDPEKVKPVNFKKCLMPCDACGLAKTTRATFRGKVMTNLTIGSVWQADVSGKWPVPSIQGKHYVIGFIERSSRKLFLYFSKNKEVYAQTKDLIESEIPKLRVRHGLKDFIIHSDVGEFQSDKIRSLVRTMGGEIQKGSAYTPERQ